MTIKTSSFGGGGISQLAPDLTAPTTWNGLASSINIVGLNPSAGLTTAISIPAKKGSINYLTLNSLIAEDYTIKLTIDGVVIWNDVWTISGTSAILIGGPNTSTLGFDPCYFNESFLLEIQSTTDTSIGLTYVFRELL